MNRVQITGGAVLLDDVDVELVASHSWSVSDTGYARTRGVDSASALIRMHRLIYERMTSRSLSNSELIDHINRNKLDNRRHNLRLATKSQNAVNSEPRKNCTSKYAGVGYDASRSKWMSYINIDGKRFYLGRYTSEKEAAWMRDQFAAELHGEFARLNFAYE